MIALLLAIGLLIVEAYRFVELNAHGTAGLVALILSIILVVILLLPAVGSWRAP